MSRVQLALNVADIDRAVEFYSRLFAAEPAKRRPGYANFAITDPPLKLVLIENPDGRGQGPAGALNHLGVEVETPEQVQAATARLALEGLGPEGQEATTCCYARQDKAWVDDPDGAAWEVYTVLADAETFGPGPQDGENTDDDGSTCCATAGDVESADAADTVS